jgi:glycosyltransferase EpsF
MKRILHVVGTMDRAGAETMVMNLYRAIDRTKFQFDFVYFTSKKCDYDDEIESLGGTIHRIITNNPIKRANELTILLKQNPKWQTVHAHTLLSIGFHLLASKRAGVKKRIAHAHSTNDGKKSVLGKLYKFICMQLLARYTTNRIACGKAAGDFLFPDQKDIKIIPNSIDLKAFTTISDRSKMYLRKEFQLPDDTLVFLQLGRLINSKNHIFTIAIVQELKARGINFKMFFAGQGDLNDDLQQIVKEKGLENEIIFLGLRTDIPELLAGSDLMLMPSLYEGFPVVLVESQAAGTPALISDSISSEVDLGTNLIYFESLESSVAVWVERMQQILQTKKMDSEQRIEKLQQAGFDIYTNVKHLEELYIQ